MTPFIEPRLRAFAAAQAQPLGSPTAGPAPVRVKRLARGLRSEVALVSPDPKAADAVRHQRPFIVKQLNGASRREIGVYEALHECGLDLMPRILGAETLDDEHSYLYLEYVRSTESWPWRDPERAALVLQALAGLHGCEPARLQLPTLDYEPHLSESAFTTLELLESVSQERCVWVRPWMRHLRRVVAALPEIRHSLVASDTVAVHGDVHTGNVHLARRNGTERVVLLDWSHARLGSGLEDVASWLQSLGFWEPLARRHHDRLLIAYRRARGEEGALPADFRARYWLAACCNALAGALRYHVWIADPLAGNTPRRQADSMRAALHWLRVIRRADAYWSDRRA
jgi:aminoglycoside phosphotransferase (APT) family kinase protein